jgi:NUMOD3 motif
MAENNLSGDRPLPYVYRLTHRETGKFYIGYRYKNVELGLRAEDDLGIHYYSSSKIVKPHFEEYNTMILAEFFDKVAAIEFEQTLIKSEWGNPLLLNKAYLTMPDYTVIMGVRRGQKQGEEEIRKRAAANTGKKRTDETRKKMSKALTGKKIVWSEERRKKYHDKMSGREIGPEWREKLSEGQHRRFQKPEQHESNRRAAGFGFMARLKTGKVKMLEVSSGNGRVKVLYASAGLYIKASGFSKQAIYAAAYKYPGEIITRGSLTGFGFRFVEPPHLPEGIKMFNPPKWLDVAMGKKGYSDSEGEQALVARG